MDWKKISDDCGVSQRQIRKVVASLRKLKLIPAGDSVEDVDAMKGYLRQGRWLTVPQLVDLIENPDLLKALGAKAPAARAQIEALDKPGAVPIPSAAAMVVGGSTRNEYDLAALEAWIKATVPARGCTYHYLAVRLVRASGELDRKDVINRMKYVFMLIRTRPSFQGWYTVERDRKVPATIYHRPITKS